MLNRTAWTSRGLFVRIATASLVVSLITNVGLSWYVGQLNERLWRLGPSTEPEGLKLDPLVGVDATGVSVSLAPLGSDRPTFIYVLAVDCFYCERNFGNVRALAAAAASSHNFVGAVISAAEVDELRAKYPFPILSGISAADLAPYGFIGTPFTLVVDSSGMVRRRWTGAYQGRVANEVEDWFKVRLPGLLNVAAAEKKGGLVPVTPAPLR